MPEMEDIDANKELELLDANEWQQYNSSQLFQLCIMYVYNVQCIIYKLLLRWCKDKPATILNELQTTNIIQPRS